MKMLNILKKILPGALFALALVTVTLSFSATRSRAALFVEQVQSKAPVIKVFVQGDMDETSKFSGKIGGVDKDGNQTTIELTQDGVTTRAKRDDGAVRFIFLLDNSRSVSEKQFKAVKDSLVQFRKDISTRKKVRMSLYTVGVDNAKDARVSVLESASGNKSEKKDIAAIKGIKRDGGKTVLYRTINEFTAQGAGNGERTVIVLLTDGEDDSTGEKNDPATTLKNVKKSSIPVYGILLEYGLSGDGDVKKIKTTREMVNSTGQNDRAVRGYDISQETGASAVKKAFKRLNHLLWEHTYAVTLQADNNRTLTDTLLTITKAGSTNEEVNIQGVVYSGHEIDTIAPQISDVEVVDSTTIRFTVSDDNGLNKDDILNKANYRLSRSSASGSSADLCVIGSVEIPSAGDQQTEKQVELKTDKPMINGEYQLILSGIHDASEDANMIGEETRIFTMTVGVEEAAEDDGGFFAKYWWVLVLALILIIGIVIVIIVVVKSGSSRSDGVQAGMAAEQSDKRLITMAVTDATGLTKELVWEVDGSIFVGRSEICEVRFDDEIMSEQHFVLAVTKAGCFVEDLGSSSGTNINGVRISGRRQIREGDTIQAGMETFHVQSFSQVNPAGDSRRP